MGSKENQNLIQNSYVFISGKIISGLLNIINTFIIIRLLSVEEFVLLTISYIIPDIIVSLRELGLDFASIHFISRMKNKNNLSVRKVVRINLFVKLLI
ncbi:MAG: hypothetical protein EU529_04165 [Promethearchaeota archaeon]|nr:MAG: hypothetical protein EU529_04165 [Candidatus Lokiarchaeota archaeon]